MPTGPAPARITDLASPRLVGVTPSTVPTGPGCSPATGLLGTGIGVFSPDIWALADSMPPWRLAAAMLGAIAVHTGWQLAARRQRERRDTLQRRAHRGIGPPHPVPVLTVARGVATVTAFWFLFALAALSILVTPHYLGAQLGHPAGPLDYLGPALLAAVLGTVAAAVGSGRAPTRRPPPAP